MFILVFIFTILILVVIHEFGHYIAAKKFNIKVLEFGFGLPPRAIGKKIGETIWSLNWLPFGGFVRLLGEDETDKEVLDDKRSFANQAVWKRIVVVVAGVFMNLLLAWVLFYIILGYQGFKTQIPLLIPYHFAGVYQTEEELILIGSVSPNSPAQKAGIEQSDRVLAVDGKNLQTSTDFIAIAKEKAGQEITLSLSDPQKTKFKTVKVTPRQNPPKGEGALGVSLGGLNIANIEFKDPWQKVLAGPIHSYNLVVYSGQILGKTISTAFEKHDFAPVSQNIAGPIGMTSIVKEILSVKNPLLPYLEFVAAVSLNLAVINVLPFPGLDGGRLFFLLIEAITRKKTHAVIEKYVHTIGLALLLTLIIAVTVSDVRKFF